MNTTIFISLATFALAYLLIKLLAAKSSKQVNSDNATLKESIIISAKKSNTNTKTDLLFATKAML